MKFVFLILIAFMLNCDNKFEKNKSFKGRWGLVYKESHKSYTNYKNPQFFYNHEYDYYKSEIIEITDDSIIISKALDPKGYSVDKYYYEKNKESIIRYKEESSIEIEFEFSSGELILKEHYDASDWYNYYLYRYEKFQGDYPSITWTEGLQDDDYEPNNSKANAKLIPFNAGEIHSLQTGDVDYFKVGQIPKDLYSSEFGALPVNVFIDSYEDINLTLYSGDSDEVLSYANNYDEPDPLPIELPFPVELPLLYASEGNYIKITGKNHLSTNGFYTIRFQVQQR